MSCTVHTAGTAGGREAPALPPAGRAARRAFIGVSAALFVASTLATIVWCGSMSCCETPMPGGWTLSSMYLPEPGRSWAGSATEFVGMWAVMMVAMMLPSLVPMLWRYRQAVGGDGVPHLARLTMLVGLAYFLAWTAFGVVAFLLGAAASALAGASPALAGAVPLATATVVLGAGLLQFTAWKARHLACCRSAAGPVRAIAADARTAWRHGLDLGLHCGHCCAGLTAILLVLGAMDLVAMALVTAAITLERLAPAGERVARGVGVVAITVGLYLGVRALVPG